MRNAAVVAFLGLVIVITIPATGEAYQSEPARASSQVAAFQTETHDVAVNYVALVGPAAVNLSDTNGRYMWVLTAVQSHSTHDELVIFALGFAGVMPIGCERAPLLVLPGQTTMLVAPGEQKTLIWRVRYECHSPVIPQIVRETVTVGVTHCDPGTSQPGPITEPTPGGVCPANSQAEGPETNTMNNATLATKQVLVQ